MIVSFPLHVGLRVGDISNVDVNSTVSKIWKLLKNCSLFEQRELSYFHLAENLCIPLKQMCLSCQASPAGCNDGLLGYLSSESSAWDWRPEKTQRDDCQTDQTLPSGKVTQKDTETDRRE